MEQDVIERLERIEAKEDQRIRMAKIQLALVAVLVLGLAVVLCVGLPKLQTLYLEAQTTLEQIQGLISETEGTLEAVDWSKFKDLDIEGLNTAIANLNSAVAAMQEAFAPIREFFGQFFSG